MTPSGVEHVARLRVSEARPRDAGRGLARIDPETARALGARVGDFIAIRGKRATVGKLMPAFPEQRGQGRVYVDGVTRRNAGVGLDDIVELSAVKVAIAIRVRVTPLSLSPQKRDLEYICSRVDGLPICAGDQLRVSLFGGRDASFHVDATTPTGPVVIAAETELVVNERADAQRGQPAPARAPSYEDIGGLGRQLQRVREMIELPLRYPEVFRRLGVDAPRGVLLHGPPGCGKTLIARTIARETDAKFFGVNGPEIVHKFYGQSEAHLRKIFKDASEHGPSIIFLDELDSIAPRREHVTGEVEKRIVAQLLALMDGLNPRSNLIVIAATNLPNALDPALRRPGRFDREIAIPVPDRAGRREILEVHSRGMPLADDVVLARLAERTHGFVGADLEALCREAAMICLRGLIGDIDFASHSIPYERLMALEVRMAHFEDALNEVEPSAMREVYVEIPSVRWREIGGLDEIKSRLREAIEWPLRHPALFERAGLRPAKGIMLHGPPGCGKTLLAKAIATECELNFISVKGPELLSKFVGESERGVREVFRKARTAAPCVIFFDELDAIAPRRASDGAGGSRVPERVIAQLLAELDGVEALSGVLVLAATNRVDMIDPALLRPGRFDDVVEIPLPGDDARREILELHLRGKPPLRDAPSLASLVTRTAGMNGAELAELCRRATLDALRRALRERGAAALEADASALALTLEDLERAADAIQNRADRSRA
ncbi:MAG: CDC48 family AAA ATPase [Myxococcales bacterium]|nr:CDC48 family AAA ATPase [Myxococcales bacterium]